MEFNQSSFSSELYNYLIETSHFCNPDVDANRELPLTQPPSAHSSITSGSCPGTPEMRRRQEEAMRRLASQVQWGSQVMGVLVALEHQGGKGTEILGKVNENMYKYTMRTWRRVSLSLLFLEKYFITMEIEL